MSAEAADAEKTDNGSAGQEEEKEVSRQREEFKTKKKAAKKKAAKARKAAAAAAGKVILSPFLCFRLGYVRIYIQRSAVFFSFSQPLPPGMEQVASYLATWEASARRRRH